jgi:hypothetical protein
MSEIPLHSVRRTRRGTKGLGLGYTDSDSESAHFNGNGNGLSASSRMNASGLYGDGDEPARSPRSSRPSKPSLSARKNIGSARKKGKSRYVDAEDEDEAANLLEEEHDEGGFPVDDEDDEDDSGVNQSRSARPPSTHSTTPSRGSGSGPSKDKSRTVPFRPPGR